MARRLVSILFERLIGSNDLAAGRTIEEVCADVDILEPHITPGAAR